MIVILVSPFSPLKYFVTNLAFLEIDLREHAIFTLHNLLEDNPENQKVVNAIQPSRE